MSQRTEAERIMGICNSVKYAGEQGVRDYYSQIDNGHTTEYGNTTSTAKRVGLIGAVGLGLAGVITAATIGVGAAVEANRRGAEENHQRIVAAQTELDTKVSDSFASEIDRAIADMDRYRHNHPQDVCVIDGTRFPTMSRYFIGVRGEKVGVDITFQPGTSQDRFSAQNVSEFSVVSQSDSARDKGDVSRILVKQDTEGRWTAMSTLHRDGQLIGGVTIDTLDKLGYPLPQTLKEKSEEYAGDSKIIARYVHNELDDPNWSSGQ